MSTTKRRATRILLIEDGQEMASFLCWRLAKEGYEIRHVADGAEGLRVARRDEPDLVILDWMLPGMDGLEVCRRLRMHSEVPILMLTANTEVPDRVRGLDSGANDYMIKPFDLAELVARVRAQLRAGRPISKTCLEYEDLRLDTKRFEVWRGETPVALTPREFALLTSLLREAGHVISRERLLTAVWGTNYEGNGNVLDVFIRTLRHKIAAPGLPSLIHTVRGVGYALRHEVCGP